MHRGQPPYQVPVLTTDVVLESETYIPCDSQCANCIPVTATCTCAPHEFYIEHEVSRPTHTAYACRWERRVTQIPAYKSSMRERPLLAIGHSDRFCIVSFESGPSAGREGGWGFVGEVVHIGDRELLRGEAPKRQRARKGGDTTET